MTNFKLIPVSCPCCSDVTSKTESRFKVKDFRDHCGPDTWYERCSSCGNLFLNPQPIALNKESINIYNERYQKVYSKLIQKLESPLYRRFFIAGMSLLSGSCHFTYPREAREGDSILDIGCGLGLQTKILTRRGCKVTGIDKTQKAIEYAKRIAANDEIFSTDTIDILINSDVKFDYIRMDSVIEHISDPVGFLRLINNLLKNNGRMILFTPNANAWSLKFLKDLSVSAWTPEHLVLYSSGGIKKLLQAAGYHDISIEYNSPAWWSAYNLLLYLSSLSNRQETVKADSFGLKLVSVLILPIVWIFQMFGMDEEMVVTAKSHG